MCLSFFYDFIRPVVILSQNPMGDPFGTRSVPRFCIGSLCSLNKTSTRRKRLAQDDKDGENAKTVRNGASRAPIPTASFALVLCHPERKRSKAELESNICGRTEVSEQMHKARPCGIYKGIRVSFFTQCYICKIGQPNPMGDPFGTWCVPRFCIGSLRSLNKTSTRYARSSCETSMMTTLTDKKSDFLRYTSSTTTVVPLFPAGKGSGEVRTFTTECERTESERSRVRKKQSAKGQSAKKTDFCFVFQSKRKPTA